MPYRNQPEYTKEIRDRIENAIRNYYDSPTEIKWYNESDPFNYIQKVDATVVVMIEKRVIHLQIKRSDKYVDSFSIGKSAMNAYLNKTLPVIGLIIELKDAKFLYLFAWKDFVELAREKINEWDRGNYYVIGIEDLTQNIKYKKMII